MKVSTCAARFTFFKEFEAASRRKFLLRKKFPGVKGEKPFGRKAAEPPEILHRKSFPPQRAKFPYTAFLFAKLFLCAYMLKEKSVYSSER